MSDDLNKRDTDPNLKAVKLEDQPEQDTPDDFPGRREDKADQSSEQTSVMYKLGVLLAKVFPREGASRPGQDRSEQDAPTDFPIKQVHEIEGRLPFENQILSMGILVDMWADLIPGYGAKAEEFREAYRAHRTAKSIPGLEVKASNFYSTGFSQPYRIMERNRRDPATVMVYIAKQGEDLYLSWRAYMQNDLNPSRFYILFWGSFLITVLLSRAISIAPLELFPFFAWDQDFASNVIKLAAYTVTASLVFGFIAALYGYFFRNGDYLALFRYKSSEIYIDDIIALTVAIHQSILAGTDTLGIDRASLQEAEPIFKKRRRPRF